MGSSISHDWAKLKDKKNKKKKMELNNRTGISMLHTAPQWNLLYSSLLFYRRNRIYLIQIVEFQIVEFSIYHSSFRRSKKYYNGSVALYRYLIYDLAIPKFPSDTRKIYFFRTLS